jgi:hypothetical protein
MDYYALPEVYTHPTYLDAYLVYRISTGISDSLIILLHLSPVKTSEVTILLHNLIINGKRIII